MSYTEQICLQANNSTLQATPGAAKYAASSRNHSHSVQHPFAQQFVSIIESLYPDLTKVRFKKTGQYYLLWVKQNRRSFRAKGYTPQNAARNFLSLFNYQAFQLPV